MSKTWLQRWWDRFLRAEDVEVSTEPKDENSKSSVQKPATDALAPVRCYSDPTDIYLA